MKKTALFLLTSCLLTSCLLAPGVEASSKDTFSGFKAGLQGGYSYSRLNFESKFNGKLVPEAESINQHFKTPLSGAGPRLGATLGYDHLFLNSLFLGAGVHGDWMSLKTEGDITFADTRSYKFTGTQKSAFGGRVRAGYLHKNIAPYVFGGYVRGQFDLQLTNLPKVSYSASGFQGGFGAEVLMDPRWSVGGEYTYASYPRHFIVKISDREISFKPKTHSLSLTVKYRF